MTLRGEEIRFVVKKSFDFRVWSKHKHIVIRLQCAIKVLFLAFKIQENLRCTIIIVMSQTKLNLTTTTTKIDK